MSSQPRRTTEMGEGSQSKPTRASRIAQPIRRPSMRERSLERASSLDRLTSGSYLTGSAMKTRKGSTYTTPMRTPMRTPSRSIPRTEIVLTAEKEKMPSDKKWIQTQAIKILEYLHSVESEIGSEFSVRTGLKGMSTKQFILVLSHFFKQIVGNRLSIGTNYVDDIAKILSQIGYPYTLNKSWLKTPTAPHAFNNAVVLLNWLMQFTHNKDCFSVLGNHLVPSDDFPDKEFAQLFMSRAEEGFILWNNSKEDDLKSLKQSLIDEIILRKTGVKGSEEIEKETHLLNYELDKLYEKRVVIKQEDEFLKMDKEIKDKEKLVTKLEGSCSRNEKKLKELNELIDQKEKEINDLNQRISEIKGIINTQEVSVEHREELITKISNLRRCLESKKTLINQLQDMGSDNQIKLSRLMKQKIEAISKFNNYIYQIFSDPSENLSIDVRDLLLVQGSDENLEEQLNRILPLLEEFAKRNSEEYNKYSSQLCELESQIKLATYTHETVLEQTLSEVKQRCSELEKNIEEINIQIINEKFYGDKQLEELETCLKELVELNNELKEKLEAEEAELIKMQNENQAMMKRIEDEGEKFIAEKEKVNDKLFEAIDSFRNTMEDVTLKLKDIL